MAKQPDAKTAVENIPVEELEKAIVEISAGMRKLRNSRLTERAILVLLQDSTGQSMRNIQAVLKGLEGLERRFLKTTR